MTIVPGTGAVMRGWQEADDYTLSMLPSPESFGSDSAITPTVHDLSYTARTTTGTYLKSDVVVSNKLENAPVTLDSDTPSVCVVDVDLGNVTRVTDGVCAIRASGQTGQRVISQTISTSGGQTIYDAITGIEAGSLRAYLRDQQLAALADVTPGANAQRAHAAPNNYISTNNPPITSHGATYGPVNTNNFLRNQSKPGFDALPLDALDQLLAGPGGSCEWRAWISPHHYLTWRGHGAQSGATWRALHGELIVEYSASAWTGTLCRLLPANWRTYMPDTTRVLNWTEINLWVRLYNTYQGDAYDPSAERRWVMPARLHLHNPYSAGDERLPYQKLDGAVPMSNGGDSGSPVFCGVNGTLVIFSHTQTQGAVGGLIYADLVSEINSAMAELNASGSYTVQTVDLSGFTSY